MIYTDIQEQFNKVISYSQGISDPQTDELFEKWYAAKRSFIDAFGEKLIYEVEQPVQFTLEEKAKQEYFFAFVESIYTTFGNYELGLFLEKEKEGFYSNIVTEDYVCNKGKITKGTKLIKAFKYFEDDKKTLHSLQDYASRIIQGNKIEGKLCFSVHPLDFLSTSENTYNWRSCHSLDGDYRSGNLSYMVDKATVVCYLKGVDDVQLPHFPSTVKWNSKKWRMLLFFSNRGQIVFAGRQYPFSSASALDFIKQHFLDKLLCSRFTFTLWKNDYITSEQINHYLHDIYIPLDGQLIPLRKMVVDYDNCGEEPLYFNDLLRSSCYTRPFYIDREMEYTDDTVCIGGPVPCLKCGQHNIDTSDQMVCYNCEGDEDYNYVYCDCCSTAILEGDEYYLADGETIVCQGCYENECYTCAYCQRVFFKNETVYNNQLHDFVCNKCNDKIKGE